MEVKGAVWCDVGYGDERMADANADADGELLYGMVNVMVFFSHGFIHAVMWKCMHVQHGGRDGRMGSLMMERRAHNLYIWVSR